MTHERESGSPASGAKRRAQRLERQLATAQQLTHIGSWEWEPDTNRVTWSDELYRIYGLEPQSREITLEVFLSFLHPEDRERVQGEVTRALQSGGDFAYVERIVREDGTVRELDTVGEMTEDEKGRAHLVGTCRDITNEMRARKLKAAEQDVLEMIASGETLSAVLSEITRAVEQQAPTTLASVLLVREGRVWHGAAPSLPVEYVRAIDGAPIGPRAGSCGTAAFRGEPVFVTDIETDPLWTDYRELARTHGLRACWSTPVTAADGRVAATFALYYKAPRAPTSEELQLIERAVHLARIAIQRNDLVNELRALSAHVESVRENERTAIAREIHDEMGQTLTALKMDIEWIGRRLRSSPFDEAPVAERVSEMSQMADDLVDRVRRISAELRPGVLDDLGLLAALEWQGQEIEKRSGVICSIEGPESLGGIDADVATGLFRIFQEAVTNVVRHAEAHRIEVRLEQSEDRLRLRVDDDGKGIEPAAVQLPLSFGVIGMRERALQLGGSATVTRRPEGGTRVFIDVPLANQPGSTRA